MWRRRSLLSTMGSGKGLGEGGGSGSGRSDDLCCCLSAPCWCCYILTWIMGIGLLVCGGIMVGLSE